jgi:hypothetical protein
MRFRVTSRIFEAEEALPVLDHVFYGDSIEAAFAVMVAHMGTDAFLRGCVERGQYGSIVCREERFCEAWNGKQWILVHGCR